MQQCERQAQSLGQGAGSRGRGGRGRGGRGGGWLEGRLRRRETLRQLLPQPQQIKRWLISCHHAPRARLPPLSLKNPAYLNRLLPVSARPGFQDTLLACKPLRPMRNGATSLYSVFPSVLGSHPCSAPSDGGPHVGLHPVWKLRHAANLQIPNPARR